MLSSLPLLMMSDTVHHRLWLYLGIFMQWLFARSSHNKPGFPPKGKGNMAFQKKREKQIQVEGTLGDPAGGGLCSGDPSMWRKLLIDPSVQTTSRASLSVRCPPNGRGSMLEGQARDLKALPLMAL